MSDTETEVRRAKLNRLPKWAADEIRRLEGDRDYWRMKATAGPEDSNTFAAIGPVLHADELTPLGMDTQVRFVLADRDRFERRPVEVHVQISNDRQTVEIRTVNGMLAVHPSAGNSITVGRRPR